MEESELYIGKRVVVRELGIRGEIYESLKSDSSLDRIYGVQLDETAWPKNFVATGVWHCKARDLEPE